MILKNIKFIYVALLSAAFLVACGENGSDKQQTATKASEPGTFVESSTVEEISQLVPEPQMPEMATAPGPVMLDNSVVYQEEIYKNWPYTQAPATNELKEMLDEAGKKADQTIVTVKEQTQTTLDEVTASAEEKVATVVTAESDKPYQVDDGNISANVIEGWKTYNGGGCGACHGKGAKGGVGPNLGKSVTTKLSKDDFKNIVANGKSGTLMRPNKTNKRVMGNLENLYAYLVARGDGVLGPENLIKFPFGKNE